MTITWRPGCVLEPWLASGVVLIASRSGLGSAGGPLLDLVAAGPVDGGRIVASTATATAARLADSAVGRTAPSVLAHLSLPSPPRPVFRAVLRPADRSAGRVAPTALHRSAWSGALTQDRPRDLGRMIGIQPHRAAEVEPLVVRPARGRRPALLDADLRRPGTLTPCTSGKRTCPRAQRRHLAAVLQHHGIRGRRGPSSPTAPDAAADRPPGTCSAWPAAGHLGRPQRGALGQLHLEELLGGVVQVRTSCAAIGPVGVQHQHRSRPGRSAPRRGHVLVGDRLEGQPRLGAGGRPVGLVRCGRPATR